MWGVGKGNHIEVRGSVSFPHSLGIFYTAFTQFLGFPKYGDEYKMMGLSAYGEPRFAEHVRRVVRTEGDQCRLNLDYFTHHSKGVEMTWYGGEPVLGAVFSHRMAEEFGDPRTPRSEIRQRDMDLAASVQLVLEENYFALLNFVQKQTGADRGLPGRRRGVELRGQRHDLRAYKLPRRVRTAGGARRGNLDWRGTLCTASRVEATAVL